MAANQHFCLRWNNHQRTLISVFDSLLESGTLVDCTLAAEGQYLKAHKVVLSACSPYLGVLLSTHHEKHPILILKDIRFQELKAMLDYMYKGEVNISQEQLPTFLKAAESLQIKGLTESSGLNAESKEFEERIIKRHDRKSITTPLLNHNTKPRSPPMNITDAVQPTWNQKYTIPSYRPNTPPSVRDGSISPVSRKRRKQLHPMPNSADENSATPETERDITPRVADPVIPETVSQSAIAPAPPLVAPASPFISVSNIKNEPVEKSDPKEVEQEKNALEEKLMPDVPIKTEPKYAESKPDSVTDTTYDDSVGDMTAEEDDEEIDENETSKPGPSHGEDGLQYGSAYPASGDSDGAVSSGQLECQGIDMKRWRYRYMSTWESWAAAHPGVPSIQGIPPLSLNSANNNSNEFHKEGVECPDCGRHYKLKSSLRNHQKWECGKEPQFMCPYCNYRAKQKMHVARHIERMHREKLALSDVCITNNNNISNNNNAANI